jgi:hypothetical protein
MNPPRKPHDAELGPADQVPTKKAAAKKAAAKKVAAEKAPRKVAAAKKVPAKKVPAKKAPAKKVAAKKVAAEKAPAKKAGPAALPVPAPEPDDAWADVWEQDDPPASGWERDDHPHDHPHDDHPSERFHDFDADLDDEDDFDDEADDARGTNPLDDPRVQAGLDRIQRAAHEFIAGSRALLDVAEELVEDPKAAGGLASMLGELGHVATRLARNAARSGLGGPWSGPGSDQDGDDPDDDDPPVQRIPVS